MAKFATQVEESVLAELRQLADETGVSISKIVTQAIAEHLGRVRVRPVFCEAMEEVIADNEELLARLAK